MRCETDPCSGSEQDECEGEKAPVSDSPQYPGGYVPQNPESEPERPPKSTVEPTREPEEDRPVAERFRRTTPARRLAIPARRGRGHWRLLAGTVAYVMVVGGMADYVEPRTRAVAHLSFWVLILLALLVTLWRERRHGWTSRARWPFLVGAIGGAVAVEALVLLFGSPTIIVGSIILLTLVLFVLMLAG